MKDKIGLIISLGGSPEACAFAIGSDISYLLVFASEQSRGLIGEIQRLVEQKGDRWPTHTQQLITENPEDLISCYRTLEKSVFPWLRQNDLEASDIRVDFTGGTKCMSAALVLYSSLHIDTLTYVGGNTRTKDGLGPATTSDYLKSSTNPVEITLSSIWKEWSRLAKQARYELIAESAEQRKNQVNDSGLKQICEIVGLVYRAIAAWDRLQPPKYIGDLGSALAKIETYLAERNMGDIRKWSVQLTALLDHMKAIQSGNECTQGNALIHNLVANAIRRGEKECRFEDAVARFYSAMERLMQMRIREAYGDSPNKFPLTAVPERLRTEYSLKFQLESDSKFIRFGLDAGMRLLAEKGNPAGLAFVSPDGPWQGQQSLLQMRNHSLLGHGITPVSQDNYRRFRDEFLKLWNVDEKALPKVPELPESWI